MTISIITPTYNSENYIRDTIESVLNQTYPHIDYLIIDGKSTDHTASIIQEYAPKFQAKGRQYRWISEPDHGMYDAINKGFELAKGEIVTQLNSDDYYTHSDVITNVMRRFEATNDDCLYANSTIINAQGEILKKVPALAFKKRYLLTLGLFFFQPSFFWKCALFEKTSYYDLTYRICADFDLIIRLIQASNNKIAKLNDYIVNFRYVPESFGNTNHQEAQTETKDIRAYYQKQFGYSAMMLLCFSIFDRLHQKIYRMLCSK